MKKNKGIICIETEWEHTKIGNRRNIHSEELVRFLANLHDVPYIYRQVATKAELLYYLKEFHKKEYDKYNVFYLSFHGQTGIISLEDGEDLLLTDLSHLANGLFAGRCVHFSSCRTFIGSQTNINSFAENTGAKLVTGYSKSVPIDLSASNDSILIGLMLDKQQKAAIIKNLYRLCEGLCETLGFRHSPI